MAISRLADGGVSGGGPAGGGGMKLSSSSPGDVVVVGECQPRGGSSGSLGPNLEGLSVAGCDRRIWLSKYPSKYLSWCYQALVLVDTDELAYQA